MRFLPYVSLSGMAWYGGQDEVGTLSEEDVGRGYVLICSSYPKGPGLELTLNQQVRTLPPRHLPLPKTRYSYAVGWWDLVCFVCTWLAMLWSCRDQEAFLEI